MLWHRRTAYPLSWPRWPPPPCPAKHHNPHLMHVIALRGFPGHRRWTRRPWEKARGCRSTPHRRGGRVRDAHQGCSTRPQGSTCLRRTDGKLTATLKKISRNLWTRMSSRFFSGPMSAHGLFEYEISPLVRSCPIIVPTSMVSFSAGARGYDGPRKTRKPSPSRGPAERGRRSRVGGPKYLSWKLLER